LLVPLILALTVTGGVVAPATASARQSVPGATSGVSAAGSTQAQCGRLVRERVGAWLCMATSIVQAQAARVADIGLPASGYCKISGRWYVSSAGDIRARYWKRPAGSAPGLSSANAVRA
jgi:hypothetical protein